jgi:hypothetical protein
MMHVGYSFSATAGCTWTSGGCLFVVDAPYGWQSRCAIAMFLNNSNTQEGTRPHERRR